MGNIKEVWFLTSELESERASSFRQERWCCYFLKEGALLRIFNLRGIFSYSDIICVDKDSLALFRKSGLANYQGPQASVREGIVAKILRRLKHLMLADLYLPNVFSLCIRLDKLLADRIEPVVIFASSPPFSLAVIGFLMKRRYKDKAIFIIDMRDAWALHNALGGIRWIKRGIERRVLQIANQVITVSIGLADEFELHYGIKVEVAYNVATHYIENDFPERIDLHKIHPEIDPNRIVIVYTGSVPEFHYDITSMINAIRKFSIENKEISQRIQLVFIGACDIVKQEASAQVIDQKSIIFVDHLPHHLIRSVQASASALLLLAHHGPKNRGVVSTKLFEYLCLSKPILPIDLCQGSDVDILLKKYCGSSLNIHKSEEIQKILQRIAENGVSFLPKIVNVQDIGDLMDSYEILTKRILQ